MDEQQLQQQIVQLVLAAMQGNEQANQLILQIIQAAQQGDQLAALVAQMIQEVAQQMLQQQVQAAKFGAKLNYIKQLRGQCPTGYKMEYFKKGGQLCKLCVKSEKQVTLQFKCGGKKKKACGGNIKKEADGGNMPTAPSAKKRYAGGTYISQTYGPAVLGEAIGISNKQSIPTGEAVIGADGTFFKHPSIIRRNIVKNDTVVSETPSHYKLVPISTGRRATSNGNRQEFETLNRRFNEAKSVSK